jgi:hypothetical protein
MMFLNCPAYLDHEGAVRCGLPAEVRCRFTMRSTDGPVEGVMIRCPAGHCFSGAVESLTWDGKDKHDPGTAAVASPAGRDSLQHGHDDRRGGGGSAVRHFPAEPERRDRRPNTAPAYYLGHPPPCGSSSCARVAGPPPPVTRWKPPSAAVTQSGTPACSSTVDSPVTGTGQQITARPRLGEGHGHEPGPHPAGQPRAR